MSRPLWQELTIVLIIKSIALFSLWWFCFSASPTITESAMVASHLSIYKE